MRCVISRQFRTPKRYLVAWLLQVFMLVGADATSAQVPDLPGWQLAWQDEFDGPEVDTSKWEVLSRQNSFNNEKQYYLPEQASIVDGNLRITATDEPIANKAYRSARLEGWQAFGYGRFEARVDLPTTQGMWPAFWMFPNRDVPWPTGGEIDILENRGSQPFLTSSAYHWNTVPNTSIYSFSEYTATDESGEPVNFHSGFHTYAAEWEEGVIRFYVDGNLHYTVTSQTAMIFDTPKNLILNLAVGGHFGGDPDASTVFPQRMDVDYVRVWQRPTGLPGDYNGDGIVNAGDYTVWRDSVGQTGVGLAADGSGNGTIGPSDFDIWQANFGAVGTTAAAASGSNPSNIPEPGSKVLWVCAAAGALPTRLGPRTCRRMCARVHRLPCLSISAW